MILGRLREEQGFTLVEILVAIMVLAVGIMGLSAVFPLATRDIGETGLRSKALQLCQEKVEDLHALAYDSNELDPAYTHADARNPIDGVYTLTWDVTANVPMGGCKWIDVTVTWNVNETGSVSLAAAVASAGR